MGLGEWQLGQTDDPTKLVPGDVGAITESVGHLKTFDTAFGEIADDLNKIDTTHWEGAAAEAFRAQYHQHSQQWLDASDACHQAAAALEDYAHTVRWAQGQAQEAIRLYDQAKHDSEGIADRARAQEILDDARRQRNDAGERAKAVMHGATAEAPAEPRFSERLLDKADGDRACGDTGEQAAQADRLGAAADHTIDLSAMTDTPVWRDSAEPLYRADNRDPSEIFRDGFQPKDPTNVDLRTFVQTNNPSAFVSTSRDAELYRQWGAQYRYDIEAPGGIDVNKTLGPHLFENEKEIAFPGGVNSRFVKGANRVNTDGSLGEWIPNPRVQPSMRR